MNDPSNGTERDIPKVFFSEWIQVYIPNTSVEATYPLPPEQLNCFIDFVYPPNLVFFAKSVLETTARLLNNSILPEVAQYRPDKKRFPTLEKQIREWTKPMEVIHVNRVEKKSRILKYSNTEKCSMSFLWVKHPEWPDWPTTWPDRLIKGTEDGEKWQRWANDRRNVKLRLIK
ncbi:MAG: hypothetical protein LBG06_01660 [Deltaproteobacteria bacterium]|jgi:hypothetical protein|nr:hypothetical protein [Deltaproteobacteria bacterium]